MKRFYRWLLVLVLVAAAAGITGAKADTYGTLNQKMATRTGPSTKYDEPGTFFNGKWQGQRVRVIDGPYKGCTGFIKRVKGDRRLLVSVEGLALVATSYIPSAFLEKI